MSLREIARRAMIDELEWELHCMEMAGQENTATYFEMVATLNKLYEEVQ